MSNLAYILQIRKGNAKKTLYQNLIYAKTLKIGSNLWVYFSIGLLAQGAK